MQKDLKFSSKYGANWKFKLFKGSGFVLCVFRCKLRVSPREPAWSWGLLGESEKYELGFSARGSAQ